MSAALAASGRGLRVVLLEARPWTGGFFDYRAAAGSVGLPLYEKARELAQSIAEATDIRLLTHTAVVGVYNNNLVTAVQSGTETDHFDERYLEIRARSVVVATGCIERPLLFENNERPGVMQINTAHRLARTYGLLPGEKAVFSVGHDLGLEAALDLSSLGLNIACVADIREDGQDPKLVAALEERNILFLRGWVAAEAHGEKRVTRATLSTITGNRRRLFDCDLLVASAGMTPVSGPLSLAHARFEYDIHTGFFLPAEMPANMHAAGRLLGLTDDAAIQASGSLAGLKAAADCGGSRKSTRAGYARRFTRGLPRLIR